MTKTLQEPHGPNVRRQQVVVASLTGAAVCVWYLDIWKGHPGLTQILLLARNAALLATVVYGIALLPAVGRERLPGTTGSSGPLAA